uniref:Uncharacterized protein n=1 Tax=Amphimedon queenslandica TaxID=400682 RepID=A0A1X7T1G2_AMPQE
MRLRVRIPLWSEVFLFFNIFFRDPNTILANRRPGFYLRKYGKRPGFYLNIYGTYY